MGGENEEGRLSTLWCRQSEFGRSKRDTTVFLNRTPETGKPGERQHTKRAAVECRSDLICLEKGGGEKMKSFRIPGVLRPCSSDVSGAASPRNSSISVRDLVSCADGGGEEVRKEKKKKSLSLTFP
ncbi:hypothetical protein HPB50_023262 [Hyalomma asiaticum]|uniref:Uncharacterized protein n=1 Tax=Hyalomma asiaticum TaxID=266040 RepID=A0ACB7SBE4_HYAAI|nr:hypothetical protein HPB50_023262 [Hyalomma asiaticum]